MQDFSDIILANAKAKGKRPYFFDDPAVERMLNITMALAGELAVTHERLDTIERILEQKGIMQRDEIESYVPDVKSQEERQQWHATFIARIMRIVQQELEALEQDPKNNRSMEEIADELANS